MEGPILTVSGVTRVISSPLPPPIPWLNVAKGEENGKVQKETSCD